MKKLTNQQKAAYKAWRAIYARDKFYDKYGSTAFNVVRMLTLQAEHGDNSSYTDRMICLIANISPQQLAGYRANITAGTYDWPTSLGKRNQYYVKSLLQSCNFTQM